MEYYSKLCVIFSRTESNKVRAERKFGNLGRIKEKIASEGVSRHAPSNRCLQEPDNEMEKIAMNPQEKIFHKQSRLGLKRKVGTRFVRFQAFDDKTGFTVQ